MAFDHLSYVPRAEEFLASQLRDGTLTLFLGAGASSGGGLPSWPELLRRMAQASGAVINPVLDDASADELQLAADRIRSTVCKDDEEFTVLVKGCLYDGVALSAGHLRNELLIALGAMMMGSRRGSVKRVVTLNFDSLLEWYLSLCGFVARVVAQPPCLEGREDVRIYHPHGFLAHPTMSGEDSKFVILGMNAINRRLGTQGDVWFETTRQVLRTGVCLFVGTSIRTFRDRALAPLFATVGDAVAATRPLGIWLLCDVDAGEQAALSQEMLASGVVPVFLRDRSDVPTFLLSICRRAATWPT